MFELAVLIKRGKQRAVLALASFLAALMLGGVAAAIDTPAGANTTAGITAGVTAYENGRFADAIDYWQKAIAPHSPDLTRAYLLSNLSAAYQALAQFQNAQTALAESLSIIESWPQQDQTYWEVSARVLNTQGQSQWQQGQSQQALATWQQAEAHYQKAQPAQSDQALLNSNTSGQVLSQINQAMALQELGFNAQAVRLLNQIVPQVSALNPSLQGVAAKELGRALRGVGELSAAQSLLTARIATAPSSGPARPALQLELGHTARALSHRAIALGKLSLARDYARAAISAYTAAAQPADTETTDPLLQTQAQLNQLSYLVEIGQTEAAQSFWQNISLADLPTGRAVVEADISYAHSLGCLQVPTSAACVKQEWQEELGSISSAARSDQSLWEPMTALLNDAVRAARALQDPLLESYATGELGHVYELSQQWAEAKALSEKALQLLEGKSVPEAAYRWQWQLGRLYWQQAKREAPGSQFRQQAILAYQQAIDSLAAVRQNLLLVDSQVQFSFRDNVEPIYREFVAILLNDETTDAVEPDQQSLQRAVKTLDALQLTELENFLGCNLSQLVNLNESNSDPNAVKIYPIILPDQIAIIFEVPDQPIDFRRVKVAQADVEQTLKSLRTNLTLPGKTPAVIAEASQIYQWLIAPLEDTLAANRQLETLVFVPDGLLRNIPMGVLYDGDRYLVEKDYALAIAPQLSLFAPRPMPQQLKVLRGGIGLSQTIRGQSFPPIELVKTELDQIPESLTVAPPLLNEAFTKANIEQQLATYEYSAIHWKTHGVFSSTPAETFLVAYQDGITANGLSALVRSASQTQAEPLELLVLSACATAQGDRRAVLGLAGIAIRAGTRSTLSTLWRADDRANTQLMTYFYQGLNEGLSKAKALQRAQRALLTEEGYPAPYYWASYVLVGNWL